MVEITPLLVEWGWLTDPMGIDGDTVVTVADARATVDGEVLTLLVDQVCALSWCIHWASRRRVIRALAEAADVVITRVHLLYFDERGVLVEEILEA